MTLEELREVKTEYENKIIDLLNEMEKKIGCEIAGIDIQNHVESMQMATIEEGNMTVRKQLNIIIVI
jgi:GH35 family endo-1,4-beta-xylanase